MNSIISIFVPVPISAVPMWATLLNDKVCAGFPSPAEDLGAKRIDLAELLIKHSQATYFLRASGHSMVEAGIFDKDLLVVDRAIKPRHQAAPQPHRGRSGRWRFHGQTPLSKGRAHQIEVG